MKLLSPLLALSVALSIGYADFEPVQSRAYSTDLVADGYRNGRMPMERMLNVDGCLLERDAAYTLSLMLEAARADGMNLQGLSCYRTLAQQRAAYERACPYVTTDVVGTDAVTGEPVVVGTRRARECSGPPVASPGNSNHGWGRAVDFGRSGRVLTCRDRELRWLQLNAHRFGWVHPDWAACGLRTQEPWHWEWGAVQERSLIDPYELFPMFHLVG